MAEESATVLSRTARTAVAAIDPAIASAETMKQKVIRKTQEIVTGYLPGGLPFDFLALLDMLISLLRAVKGRIIAGDNVYRTFRATKNQRGSAVRGLTQRAESAGRRVRTDLRRHYGDDVLVDVLMTEAPNSKRFELLEQLKQFLAILRGFVKEDYEPLESMGQLDVDAKIAYLEGFATRLGDGQTVYELAVKEAEKERQALRRLIRAERQVGVHAIGMLESSYRMAGFNEEADRLRYLIRRAARGKTEDEDGQEPASPGDLPDVDDPQEEPREPPSRPSPGTAPPL